LLSWAEEKGGSIMEWLKSVIDYGVIGLLAAMSVVAVGVAIERGLYYRGIDMNRFTHKKELELALTRKLYLIATVGSNAPYIGLLGTVLGIMLTFYAMGREGFMDTGKIMIGLALALKATAAGLVVAIPAIILYNVQVRRAKELILKWEVRNGRKGV
jgi:biopolymer transport protein ExbB